MFAGCEEKRSPDYVNVTRILHQRKQKLRSTHK